MNEVITENIDRYLKDNSPRYALLISGSWGCGKTHYIENWKKQYEEKLLESLCEEDKKKIIKPVKISLFGCSSINDIYERLREALNPKIYRAVKLTGFIAGAVSKGFLGSDVLEDANIPVQADLAVWDGFNKEAKGCRLLILDDLERCNVPIVEVFGFIDMFLNLYDFHVLVIGDDKHLQQDEEKIYNQYKEKIFGNVFLLQPDVDSAIDAFIREGKELSEQAGVLYDNNRNLIKDVFVASTYRNLRTLRQAMHQFAFICGELHDGADEYKSEVLANYLTMAIEYHNNQAINLETQIPLTGYGIFHRDDEFAKMTSKYQFVEGKYRISLFKGYGYILNSIKYGQSITQTINSVIEKRINKPLSEQYKHYCTMSNEEFKQKSEALRTYLACEITNLYEYIRVLFLYCKVQKERLIVSDREFVQECADKCVLVLRRVSNLNDFVAFESCVRQALSSVPFENEIKSFSEVRDKLMETIEYQKKNLPDQLTFIMEHLSDDNINLFKDVIMGADPYHHAQYELLPIFDKINPDAFVHGYLSLNNENKDIACVYISYRYERLANSSGLRERLLQDIYTMAQIAEMLKKKYNSLRYIDKLQVKKMVTMLETSITELQKPDR